MTDHPQRSRIIAAVCLALAASVLFNVFLWQKGKQYEVAIAQLNHHVGQVAKDLTKEKQGVEATLAECNSALAAVQAKPVPVCAVPLPPPACPAPLPPPVCPAAPTCPLAPTCAACPEVAAPAVCPTAQPAQDIEPHKVIHFYFRQHRHHIRRTRKAPDECPWKNHDQK